MDIMPRSGQKVMLIDTDFKVGQVYNSRKFEQKNELAKGKILTVDSRGTNIFDVKEPGFGVFHIKWVNELTQVSNENLITAVILGGLSEEEYESIIKERS